VTVLNPNVSGTGQIDLNPTGYAQVVEESVNGSIQRSYSYGLQRIDVNQLVNNTWTLSFYGYDGSGSVRQLTDTAAAVTDTCQYGAFGNNVAATGTTPNNYRYRGEQWDSDLGLYYLSARYYNPATGRFLTRDPSDGDVSEPAKLHKYLYADGDPVNGADPTGLQDVEEYALTLRRISLSPEVIAGLEFLRAAIICAYVSEGSRLLAENVAGPFGTVEQVSPCLWTQIYDIGASPGRKNFPWPTSPYYAMELYQIHQRGYPTIPILPVGRSEPNPIPPE
jgi:RHS repeat-associated protein